MSDALTQESLRATLAAFWHPVCTLSELESTPGGVLGRRLLGRDLAVKVLLEKYANLRLVELRPVATS